MIDISKKKYDLSTEDEFAINWMNKNGYNGIIEKQFVSKTVFNLEKDGVTGIFELPQNIKNVSLYMSQFEKCWDSKVKIKNMNL